MLREVGPNALHRCGWARFSLFPANEDDPDHVLLMKLDTICSCKLPLPLHLNAPKGVAWILFFGWVGLALFITFHLAVLLHFAFRDA